MCAFYSLLLAVFGPKKRQITADEVVEKKKKRSELIASVGRAYLAIDGLVHDGKDRVGVKGEPVVEPLQKGVGDFPWAVEEGGLKLKGGRVRGLVEVKIRNESRTARMSDTTCIYIVRRSKGIWFIRPKFPHQIVQPLKAPRHAQPRETEELEA